MIDRTAGTASAAMTPPSARVRFSLVAAGSAVALFSLVLPWAHSGASAIPGYRIPAAVRLLSDAGLAGRWILIPWAVVPLASVAAWLALWIRGGTGRAHALAGGLIAAAALFFAVRSGVAAGPLVSIGAGTAIAFGGLNSGSTKGQTR